MKRHRSRLFPARSGGLHEDLGRYWKGQRAETIVADRAAARQRSRRKPRSGSTPTQSPQRELRRLERALARRKTLAARQRVQQRIDNLKNQLQLGQAALGLIDPKTWDGGLVAKGKPGKTYVVPIC